jgi:hypothetical protein
MFRSLHSILSPGGTLATQSGGEGSILEIRTILTKLGVVWEPMNNSAHGSDTTAALAAAGCAGVECWMTNEPVEFDDVAALQAYILDGVIAPYVSDRPPQERLRLANEVTRQLDAPILHFVRLNVRAVAGSC